MKTLFTEDISATIVGKVALKDVNKESKDIVTFLCIGVWRRSCCTYDQDLEL